ncbi:hypothetical protein WISP_86225 [Willisornis vidua]|uniref:ASTN2 protein n=1 Tax=Willisornis vidua TaxID=1566151 RepID=A0ABQ9D361_9PASS|nr:hypothetical protein WISP_86225 [Willisornis vidua]
MLGNLAGEGVEPYGLVWVDGAQALLSPPTLCGQGVEEEDLVSAPTMVPEVLELMLLSVLEQTPCRQGSQEMSGTVADISLVHWKQQWLENGTLYFHVSMSSAEQLSRATPPSLQEPSEIVEEQMHILHISVMTKIPFLLRMRNSSPLLVFKLYVPVHHQPSIVLWGQEKIQKGFPSISFKWLEHAFTCLLILQLSYRSWGRASGDLAHDAPALKIAEEGKVIPVQHPVHTPYVSLTFSTAQLTVWWCYLCLDYLGGFEVHEMRGADTRVVVDKGERRELSREGLGLEYIELCQQGGLIALLLLLLVFMVALYAQRRWHKRRRIPQKSASTEATHEIHYIPSVLLGPQARESFRNSRLQAHNSVIGVPIRETPILDDYEDEEEEETPRRAEPSTREDEFGSQVTRTLESLGRGGEEKPDYEKKAPEVTQETVESLMQKFKESFRTNTPIEIGQLQPALRSTSVGRRKRRSRPRGGIGFGRAKGNSGSEADDETQLTFYTEQYRSRKRSKGGQGKVYKAASSMKSPVNKTALTLIAVSSCVLAVVCGSQLSCPLTVKVTLHVPEHFIADGSSFVVSEGSYLDISDWLNPAKLSLYYQINATSPWVRDLCGQRTTDACEQLCDQDTGECSCHEGYAPDPVHRHLCVRSDWGHSEGPWPYTTLERGYDLVTGEQAPEKILRSTYSLGQGLWLPVSKSFVVPPVELSINPLASCKTDVLVTEDPADVREEAMLSTYFETINDLLSSFGPVRDCSRNNGGCTRNFKCVSDRKVDSTGCVCPEDLRPMKDGTGCYDYSKGIDCSDGFNGGCEQLCLQQTLPLPHDPSSSTIFMFCGCVEEYKLAPDGKSCLMLSDICEGPKCLKSDAKFNDTLFGEMLHGYNNRTQHVNQGQVFQMTFRENNFIKDFPQLADGLLVIPLPVEEQCRGVLSEPLPNLQLLTGDIKYDEAMGYPMVQHWRVRSNLYRVKLSSITLSSGFANILKILNKDSSREELLSFIQQFGSHYIAEALYGSEFSCTIHFPSKKVQQQLWLQYQKGEEVVGVARGTKASCRLMFSIHHPFITPVSGLWQEFVPV